VVLSLRRLLIKGLYSLCRHLGGLHFLFNNYALWSFSAAALFSPLFFAGEDGKGKHTAVASHTPHVLAFFATAGVFSALLPHLVKVVMFRSVAMRSGLQVAKLTFGKMGSLGASGSVYAFVVMSALASPDARIG
jgi:rhomboid-like protein